MKKKTKTAFVLRIIKFAQFPFGVSSSKQTWESTTPEITKNSL
jgi:hypothetical protein